MPQPVDAAVAAAALAAAADAAAAVAAAADAEPAAALAAAALAVAANHDERPRGVRNERRAADGPHVDPQQQGRVVHRRVRARGQGVRRVGAAVGHQHQSLLRHLQRRAEHGLRFHRPRSLGRQPVGGAQRRHRQQAVLLPAVVEPYGHVSVRPLAPGIPARLCNAVGTSPSPPSPLLPTIDPTPATEPQLPGGTLPDGVAGPFLCDASGCDGCLDKGHEHVASADVCLAIYQSLDPQQAPYGGDVIWKGTISDPDGRGHPPGCSMMFLAPPSNGGSPASTDADMRYNSPGQQDQVADYGDANLLAVSMEIVFWCASETSPSPPPPSNPPFRPAHSVTPYGSAPCVEVAAIEGRVDVRDISAVSNCGDLMNRPWYTRAHCDNFYKSKTDGSYILCRLGTSSETEPDCVGWDTVACSPRARATVAAAVAAAAAVAEPAAAHVPAARRRR